MNTPIQNLTNILNANKSFSIKVLEGDKVAEYFDQKLVEKKHHWEEITQHMLATNVDISLFGNPAYQNKVEILDLKFEFMIFTEAAVVDLIVRGKRPADAVFQLWLGQKSLIGPVCFHPKCNRRWNNELVQLSDWEMTMTSMVLNAEEGVGSIHLAKDVLNSLAIKEPTKFGKVLEVLN